jgi:hypothetical protein
MKRLKTSLASALLLLSTSPAVAAEKVAAKVSKEEQEMNAAMSALSGLFKVEPLTADQQSRLPAANAVVEQMMPPGALQQMMGSMFDKILEPLMALEGKSSAVSVARELGLNTATLNLDEETAGKIAALVDPQWQERRKREMAAMPKIISDVMTVMEPTMRKVMGELYAVNFNAGELKEISTFFATPTGGNYARRSFSMSADPRMMAGMFEAMPALMGQMGSIKAKMAAATADLPAKRTFTDLSAAEKGKLAKLTGLSEAALAEQIAARSGEEK